MRGWIKDPDAEVDSERKVEGAMRTNKL